MKTLNKNETENDGEKITEIIEEKEIKIGIKRKKKERKGKN
jgi:hypothetical protein